MISDRKSRLFKGVAADGIFQFSQMFVRFVEVPLLLYFWGVELFGEWLIITSIPAYLSISDFGFTHVTAREVVMKVAAGDKEEAMATYQSSAVLVGLMSSVIAVLFFLLIWLLPLNAIFSIAKLSHAELLAIAALMGIKIMVFMQTGMLGSALQATGQYPLFFLLTSAIYVGEFILFALVVAAGGGPVMAAGAMLAGVVIGMFVTHLMVRRFAPWFSLSFGFFRIEILRKLAKPALAALSFPASQALNFQGTLLVIASALGPTAVALFAPHRQLAGFVTRTNIIGRSVNVELGLAYGANDMAAFKKLSIQSTQILLWASVIAALAITIAAWFVFPMWTGGRLQFDPTLLFLLVLVSVCEAVWRAAFQPASATNRHQQLAKIVLLVNIGMLLLMYGLCLYLGLIGSSLTLLLSGLITSLYAIRNALIIIQADASELLGSIIRPPTYILSRLLNKSP